MDARLTFPFFFAFGEGIMEPQERTLEQLHGLSVAISSPFLAKQLTAKFRLQEKIETEEKAAFRRLYSKQGWIKRWTNAGAYVVADFEIPYLPIKELRLRLKEANYSHGTEKMCYEVASRRLAYDFENIFFDLSVCANIANLGTFRVDDGALITSAGLFGIQSYASICDEARLFLVESPWPAIQELELPSVYSWYSQIPGTMDGYSNNSLGRAVCAFTYLFHQDVSRRALMDLVWGLCGIEALLGEADQSRRIITDKLLLIFPVTTNDGATEARKSIREMYDFRSRMLHGNRNISSRRLEFGEADGSFEIKKYVREEHRATCLAVAILSQLVSYCFQRNITDIKTKIALEETKSAIEESVGRTQPKKNEQNK